VSNNENKRVHSHSASPHPKRKKKKQWFKKHKKHYSTIAAISPIKKMIQSYKNKNFFNKSGEKEKMLREFQKNFSKNRMAVQKKQKMAKTKDQYYKSIKRIRDWSPISNKYSDLRKNVNNKK
jgi:hypothetical protein